MPAGRCVTTGPGLVRFFGDLPESPTTQRVVCTPFRAFIVARRRLPARSESLSSETMVP